MFRAARRAQRRTQLCVTLAAHDQRAGVAVHRLRQHPVATGGQRLNRLRDAADIDLRASGQRHAGLRGSDRHRATTDHAALHQAVVGRGANENARHRDHRVGAHRQVAGVANVGRAQRQVHIAAQRTDASVHIQAIDG